jgi:site-specific recombinase XerD
MLRKGIPIAVVSKILGHASLATTMIYADENEEGRRNIYREKMK